MADFYKLLEAEKNFYAKGNTVAKTPDPVTKEFNIDPNVTLKKDDLLKGQYVDHIRDYMIDRKGVDYKELSDQEVVDDFVEHMRYFNANSVSTAGEVRFIGKADDMRKAKARRAYQIYDQLGNVFMNDGAMGAVDGVKDYILASAADPTNYAGLITGGVSRLFAGGVSLTGKRAIRAAVRAAGKEALKGGATKEAAKEAGRRAGSEAAARAIAKGATQKTADKLYAQVAKKAASEGKREMARKAMLDKSNDILAGAAKRSLKYTVGFDAMAAAAQDVMQQRTYLKVGAQEEYSKLQTGFSSLLGGVAGAAQLGFGKFRGASGYADSGDPIEKVANNVIEEYSPILDKVETKAAADSIKKNVAEWNAKVERGKEATEATMPADLIKNIMFGSDGESGLVKIFKEKGFKLSRNKTVSDVITNVARFIPEEDLAAINKDMIKYTGIQLGELSETGVQLGDLLAKDISTAGSILNVQSQVRKALDTTIVTASNKMQQTFDNIETKEAITRELKRAEKSEPFRYGQSVWKRLLVSSPATTMINVAGFSQYYAGQTLADIFNATFLTTKALGQAAYNPTAAKESLRQARILTVIQGQKMRNLLDPYTTHDAYLSFLNKNESIKKTLFETMAGGVEATAERYNINPNNPLFKTLEAYATASSQLTGVRIQDSFTKSQMFMTELDKYLQINNKMSLREAILTDGVIDDKSLQGALDGTLKSVFAKDYTTKEQPELLRTAAKLVETFSNVPMLGTILPFGRFFNNVVATAYQWSPFAAPETTIKFLKNQFSKNPDITNNEAFAKMLVGSAGLRAAMEYDEKRREKELGVYDVDVGGGTIIDAKNTFPFSVFLAAGRIGNMLRNGEPIPDELKIEIGTQVGVGQFARDVQFANDINNILDLFLNEDEAARAASIEGFYKVGGNFLAGFTRPVDAVNKAFGMITNTDTAKDVRQGTGMQVLTQSATKYIDNVYESFFDKVDGISGEELRVATREGDIYDPNPFARMFGLTIKPGRTATEKAYSMANMHTWRANERTNIPAYDKALNSLVAPILERHTERLVRTKAFKDASLTGKRTMLKNVLKEVKAYTKKQMDKGYSGPKNELLRIQNKAARVGNKEIRAEAMRLMKERYGVTGNLEDFTYRELDMFMEYVEYLEEIYDETSRM